MSNQELSTPQEVLQHYGVKGMRWGVRKKYSESRKEYRSRLNKESTDFYNKKVATILNEVAKKGDKVLIETRMPGDYARTITTGKQFVDHLIGGGAFDVSVTEVFARQGKANTPYVRNDKPIGVYKKSDRR